MKFKITFLSALLCSAVGFSQAEFINSDFGENGLLCVDIPGETIKMGDIIKVGNEFYGLANFMNHHLVKFSANGELDTSFGTNGYKPVNIGYNEGGLGYKESHIIMTPDNNFLIVSVFNGGFNNAFIAKTDLSGNVIPSFGTNGFVSSWGQDRIFFYSAEIVDNEIVLTGAGNSNDAENPYRYLIVMKYDLNGNPVTTFGNNGSLTTYLDNEVMALDAHYYADSNSIVMIGAYWSEQDEYSFVAKYNMVSGTPDLSFGTNGKVIYSSGETSYTMVRTLNCTGNNIYVGGFENNGTQPILFLNKLGQDGQPDTTFGTNGTFKKSVQGTWYNVPAYVSEDNGDFLITGQLMYDGENYEKIFLLKINANGTPATNFGNNGMIVNPMNLAHIGAGFQTIIEENTITVATLSMSCTSGDQPKPAVVQFVTGELSNDEHQQAAVSYYPNPVKDNLYFSSPVEKVEVYDLSGKMVISAMAISGSIDLSQLQKGFYIVRIVQNGTASNIKIVKE